MDKMAKKADLNDAQKQDVLRFVLAVRDVPVAPAATGSASAPAKP
jgi:hypothetical protein